MDELDELIEDFEWRASLEKELAKSAFARDSFDFAEKHERNETKYNRVAELLKELKEYKIKDGKTESEDCISREETLNKINGLIAEYIPLMPTGWTLPLNIAKTINELPPVTPSRPKGKWIDDNCSICGYGVKPWNNTPYCPNCGADMRGEDNDNR